MSPTRREVLKLTSRPAQRHRTDGGAPRTPDDNPGDEPALHVLVADDDDRSRHQLATALRGTGIDVTEARDGEQAPALATDGAPDVIVLDWPMASGGLPLAQRLIDEHGMTGRVIMLASAYDRRDHHAALKAGARYVVRAAVPGSVTAAVRLAASRAAH